MDNNRDKNKAKDNIKVETKTIAKTTTMKILPQKVWTTTATNAKTKSMTNKG